MGVAFNGSCYSTAAVASSEQCANYLINYASGATQYTTTCASVTSVNEGARTAILSLRRAQAGSATVTTQAQTLTYPLCDEMAKYNDMLTLFAWLMGGAAIVYAVKEFIYKLVANQ